MFVTYSHLFSNFILYYVSGVFTLNKSYLDIWYTIPYEDFYHRRNLVSLEREFVDTFPIIRDGHVRCMHVPEAI